MLLRAYSRKIALILRSSVKLMVVHSSRDTGLNFVVGEIKDWKNKKDRLHMTNEGGEGDWVFYSGFLCC